MQRWGHVRSPSRRIPRRCCGVRDERFTIL